MSDRRLSERRYSELIIIQTIARVGEKLVGQTTIGKKRSAFELLLLQGAVEEVNKQWHLLYRVIERSGDIHRQKLLISATNGNKRCNLMQNKILYYRSLPSITCISFF